MARAASLAVRRAKAEKRKAEVGRIQDETRTGDVFNKDSPRQARDRPETQRVEEARAAVRQDLCRKRWERFAAAH